MTKKFIQKIIAVLFINLLFLSTSYAKKISIDVNGLVCEFCASTIEKAFLKKKKIVEKVDVHLGDKKVLVFLKENQDLTDKEVRNIVINNGYNVVRIHRKE